MTFRKASLSEAETIFKLVQNTINDIYPKYYVRNNIQFFCDLHTINSIKDDILCGKVYVLIADRQIVATGSRDGDHIYRVFVAADKIGNGYGKELMRAIEEFPPAASGKFTLEASAPSVGFYQKLGYGFSGHGSVDTGGVPLYYDIMTKIV